MILWLALGCTGDEPVYYDDNDGLELARPDLSDVDLDRAVDRALEAALAATTSPVWAGNVSTLSLATDGCPDVFVGPLEDDDDLEDPEGLHWSDRCETAGGLYFSGWNYWHGELEATGAEDTLEGRTVDGSRHMLGAAATGDPDQVLYRFSGEATDTLHEVTATDYLRWTYTSSVDARLDGRDTETALSPPGGWRADLYLSAAGGNTEYLELRGNVYLIDERIGGRFDSMAMDITLQGELGASSDTCTLEPLGWFSLRDENAWWYDIVFLPTSFTLGDTGDLDAEYTSCDGCGTLYVRGQESEAIGEVCPDFDAIWQRGIVERPQDSDFLFSLRDLDQATP